MAKTKKKGSGPIKIGYAEDLVKLFGLPELEAVENPDYVWEAGEAAYERVMEDDDADPEDAEEARFEAENNASGEVFRQWKNAIESVAESLLGNIDMELIEKDSIYYATPKKDWVHTGETIREVVNGVGYFHFYSLKEFMDSGPWTPRQLVTEHFSYAAKKYPEVYGSPGAKTLYARAIR